MTTKAPLSLASVNEPSTLPLQGFTELQACDSFRSTDLRNRMRSSPSASKGGSTLDVLTPLLWLGIVTGVLPLKKVFDRENGQQVPPTFRFISFPAFWGAMSFIFLCVISIYNIVGLIVCCVNSNNKLDPELAMKLNTILHNALPILSAACIFGKAETLSEHFSCWPQIDTVLPSKNRHLRLFVWLMILQLLIHIAPSWYNFIASHYLSHEGEWSVEDMIAPALLPYWLPFLAQSVISNTAIYIPVGLFCVCAKRLAEKFFMIRDQLKEIIQTAEADGKITTLPIYELEALRNHHCKLRNAARSLCEGLSPALLVVLTVLTMMLVDQAYLMMSDAHTETLGINDPIAFNIITSTTMFLSAVIILLLAYCADEAADESRKSLPVLQTIPVLGLSTDIRQVIVAFQHDIAGSPVDFSASGYFPIDKEMLTKLLSSTVTFLLVIIQFQWHKGPAVTTSTATTTHQYRGPPTARPHVVFPS